MDNIQTTVQFVKQQLANTEGGHDWFHIERVWKNAQLIAKTEGGNLEVIELAALLHDIADYKFHNGDETIGTRKAENFLESIHVERAIIDQVVFVIEYVSFKGGHNETEHPTLELKIVQDADRLDAIGAIGIARTFNYGGFKGSKLYDPNEPPKMNQSKEEYKKSNGTTINHFYEKLLLLKDKFNTLTGKELAEKRHQYMENFLQQFYAEWKGEK